MIWELETLDNCRNEILSLLCSVWLQLGKPEKSHSCLLLSTCGSQTNLRTCVILSNLHPTILICTIWNLKSNFKFQRSNDWSWIEKYDWEYLLDRKVYFGYSIRLETESVTCYHKFIFLQRIQSMETKIFKSVQKLEIMYNSTSTSISN